MGDVVGGLAYILSANNSDFNKKFRESAGVALHMHRVADQLTGRLAKLGSAMLTAAGAAGAGALVKSQFSAIDALAKTAKKVGDTTEQLARLRFANEQAGISFSETDGILTAFEKRLGETARGTGQAVEAYKALGLSAVELAKRSPVEAFRTAVGALGRIADEYQRASVAQDVFGRSGAGIVQAIDNLTTGWDELTRQADAAGVSIGGEFAKKVEAANDAVHRTAVAASGAAGKLAVALSPAVESVANKLTAVIQATTGFATAADKLTGGLVSTTLQVGAVATAGAALAATTAYVTKNAVAFTVAIASQTKALITNTAAKLANNAASAGAGVKAASGLAAGQASRLAELRGASAGRFLAAQKAQAAAGAAIGTLAGPSAVTARAITANSAAMAEAASSAGLFTRALTAAQGAALPLTIAITAGTGAIANFTKWATEGTAAFDGWARALFTVKGWITGTNELAAAERRAANAAQDHADTVAAYLKTQDGAAAAIDRTTKALQAQKKAAEDAAGRFRNAIDPAVEGLYQAEGETDRARALRKAREETPLGTGDQFFAELKRKETEINRLYDAIDQAKARREMFDRFSGGVADAQGRVRGFGKTPEAILIEDMEKAIKEAERLKEFADATRLRGLLADMKEAQSSFDRLAKKQNDLKDAGSRFNELLEEQRSVRERMADVGRGFRPGFAQRGSLAEYEQRRNIGYAQREQAALQKQDLRLQQQLQDIMRQMLSLQQQNLPYLAGSPARLP